MRMEGKHRVSKITASSVATRKNICLTIFIRHQLLFNWLLISNQFFVDRLTFNSGESFILEKLENWEQLQAPSDKKEFRLCKHASIHGTMYKQNMVLYYDYEDTIPEFAIVRTVLVHESKTIHFIVKKLITVYYDDHTCAFHVQKTNHFVFVNQNELLDSKPLFLSTNNEGKLFVASYGIFE